MTNDLERYSGVALLLLRIGVGTIFIIAGWGKLTGIEGAQGLFGNIGIPAAGIMAWIVALIEFIGGFMVLLGAYIRVPAILLATIMVVAILTVKMQAGWGDMRIDFTLLLMNLALFIMGSGKLSVDHKLGRTGRVGEL
ncbi:MAG: DoxX family protein [Balneolaceae bacterium]